MGGLLALDTIGRTTSVEVSSPPPPPEAALADAREAGGVATFGEAIEVVDAAAEERVL